MWYFVVTGVPRRAGPMSNGHITVKAPHPIRTAKLSTVELDQYFGRGLQGNLQCCWALFFFFQYATWKRLEGRICDLEDVFVSSFSLFIFISLSQKLTNGSLRSGPPLWYPFQSQGRRCVTDHYTHEAEERNKIKFWIQIELIEFIKNFIFMLLSSCFVNLSGLQVSAPRWHKASFWLASLRTRFSFFAF